MFGRDYDDKCVVADTWTEFLDACISFIEKGKGYKVVGDFYEPDDSGTYMDEIYGRKCTEIWEEYSLDY